MVFSRLREVESEFYFHFCSDHIMSICPAHLWFLSFPSRLSFFTLVVRIFYHFFIVCSVV